MILSLKWACIGYVPHHSHSANAMKRCYSSLEVDKEEHEEGGKEEHKKGDKEGRKEGDNDPKTVDKEGDKEEHKEGDKEGHKEGDNDPKTVAKKRQRALITLASHLGSSYEETLERRLQNARERVQAAMQEVVRIKEELKDAREDRIQNMNEASLIPDAD